MWNNKIMPDPIKLLTNKEINNINSFKAPLYDSGDILYYYDGPVSFLTTFADKKVLITKIDEKDNWDEPRWEVWAIIVLSNEDIKSLKANEKPFIQYWLDRPNFIAETIPDPESRRFQWITCRVWKDVEWHPSWLPDKDVKLFQEK